MTPYHNSGVVSYNILQYIDNVPYHTGVQFNKSNYVGAIAIWPTNICDSQPWLHIRITREVYKITMPRLHSSLSVRISRGGTQASIFFKTPRVMDVVLWSHVIQVKI